MGRGDLEWTGESDEGVERDERSRILLFPSGKNVSKHTTGHHSGRSSSYVPSRNDIALYLNDPELVSQFVAVNMPIITHRREFDPCSAIGVRRGDYLIAGFVYNHYNGHSIDVTVASVNPLWAVRRDIIRALFAYPFLQLGCSRLGCMVVGDGKSKKLATGLGFTLEGVLRRGYDGVNDAQVYGMLREECKWL
jgi:RimJ/RimL family protein N-acetyltransferase